MRLEYIHARSKSSRFALIVGVITSGIVFSAASAGISQTVFSISAVNDSGVGVYAVDFSDGAWDPATHTYQWSLPGAAPLMDGATTVALLQSANLVIEMSPAPVMAYSFTVIAGESDTEFLAESARIDFNAIPASLAEASFQASCTIYDEGGGEGMWIYEPALSGSGVFQSYYNTMPAPGEEFSDLISVVGSNESGCASGSQQYPGSGYLPLNVDVYDACMRAAFILTEGDRAQGCSSFSFVPEPTSLALLALGAISIFARGTRKD